MPLHHIEVQSFSGFSLDGWNIEATGLLTESSSITSPGHAKAIWLVDKLKVKKGGASTGRVRVKSMKFALCNLIFDTGQLRINGRINGYHVEITKSEGYEGYAKALSSAGGIAWTATIAIRQHDEQPFTPTQGVAFINKVCLALSAAKGTLINWLSWEASLDNQTIREHGNRITRRYSSYVRLSLRINPNVIELANAWTRRRRWPSKLTLHRYCDYFLDACEDGQFRETKGLIMSTFLDTVAAERSIRTQKDFILPDPLFQERWECLRTQLKDSLSGLFPDASSAAMDSMLESARGLHRSSFRLRLSTLFKQLDIEESQIPKIVKIRNALVHEGHYQTEGEKSIKELQLLLWAGYCVLLRLAGYKSQLPTSEEIPS